MDAVSCLTDGFLEQVACSPGTREHESLLVLWLKGFNCYEPIGYEWRSHWCGKSGQLVFVNRCDQTRTVVATMQFRTIFKSTARLQISGGVWSDELEIGPADRPTDYAVRLVLEL